MLRDYGERILLLNMNNPETKEAFSTARESENGYILVSQHIDLKHLETVYNLDISGWEFPYSPVSPPSCNDLHGINEAEQLCQYFSRVFSRKQCRFENLEPLLRASIITIGQHYEQNLRYPGAGPQPGSLTAETPAQERQTEEAHNEAINEALQGVAEEIEKEKKKKKRIEAKSMPKKAPPPLPAKADPANH